MQSSKDIIIITVLANVVVIKLKTCLLVFWGQFDAIRLNELNTIKCFIFLQWSVNPTCSTFALNAFFSLPTYFFGMYLYIRYRGRIK